MTGATTAGAASAITIPRGSERPLAEIYDAALLDLDGVVYLGGVAIPGAADALREAGRRGMRLAFVTNNASRSPSAIAAQLTGLGVQAGASDVVTSAQAAARLLAGRLPVGSAVLVVGGIGLRIALREHGLRPVSVAAERPAAVVQGYAPDIGYPLLAEAAVAVRDGAWYVASNVDVTLPTTRGPQPGNGSLVQVIVTATGRQPVVAGKPEPPLHAEAVARTGARRPLVVGDRLDTDIAGAVRGGSDSLLVLTGVTDPSGVLLAAPRQRPTYLARDLTGLLGAHPAVTGSDGGYRCGGWTARLTAGGGHDDDGPHAPARPDGRELELAGTGDPIDGLRAACAATWSAGPGVPDRPDWPGGAVTAEMIRPALRALGFGSGQP